MTANLGRHRQHRLKQRVTSEFLVSVELRKSSSFILNFLHDVVNVLWFNFVLLYPKLQHLKIILIVWDGTAIRLLLIYINRCNLRRFQLVNFMD
jgi:hypothetical protein